jgi:hypothetical protein
MMISKNHILISILILILAVSCISQHKNQNHVLATVTPIPNWNYYENDDYSIWLPRTYIGGFVGYEDNPFEKIANIGPEFQQIAHGAEQFGNEVIFFSVHNELDDVGGLTNLIIATEEISRLETQESFVDSFISNLPGDVDLLDRKSLPNLRYTTSLLELGKFVNEVYVVQHIYIATVGNLAYKAAFTSSESHHAEHIDDYAAVYSSFVIHDPTEGMTWVDENSQAIIIAIGIALFAIGVILNSRKKISKKDKDINVH